LVVGSEIFNAENSVAENMAALRQAVDWPMTLA
jgi:hypothetical protein